MYTNFGAKAKAQFKCDKELKILRHDHRETLPRAKIPAFKGVAISLLNKS